MTMKTFKKIFPLRNALRIYRKKDKKISLVPTMGYLHDGHISLIKKARKETDVVVVSIFVNPTQFGPKEDYKRYPRNIKRDLTILKRGKVDFVFYPTASEMYRGKDVTKVVAGFSLRGGTIVEVPKMSKILCGFFRPVHFKGVTTVVAKLFNIIKPHFAYFGEKDYQQLIVIKKMVEDLNYDVKIRACPLIREKDGIALSSRNKYLSKQERKDALMLYSSLKKAKMLIKGGEKNPKVIIKKMREMISNKKSNKIDYIDIVHPETLEHVKGVKKGNMILMAVWVGKTRLIDNIRV